MFQWSFPLMTLMYVPVSQMGQGKMFIEKLFVVVDDYNVTNKGFGSL